MRSHKMITNTVMTTMVMKRLRPITAIIAAMCPAAATVVTATVVTATVVTATVMNASATVGPIARHVVIAAVMTNAQIVMASALILGSRSN